MAEQFTYNDIDLNLTKKRDGDINEFTSINAVKASIRNIILTRKGSRRMRPEFASDLWDYIFEPMDEITAQSIGEEALETIEKWDSRVIVENIHVSPIYERNLYNIQVTFRLKNSNVTDQVEIILERG